MNDIINQVESNFVIIDTFVLWNNSQVKENNKVARKKGLEKLLNILKANEHKVAELTEKDEIFMVAIKGINDSYERCRELSCDVLLSLLNRFEASEVQNITHCLVQILSRKLSTEDEYEPSEEVRLKMLGLIILLLDAFGIDVKVYSEDVVDICHQTLKDTCPSIKQKAAEIVSMLKDHHKMALKKKGIGLVEPLAKNLAHQQHRVRVAAVKALGDLVLSTDGGVFENTVSHIAQRTFDPSPHVRKQVANVTGSWLAHFPDRYSYFYKIVPLLIVSLEEDVPDIKETAGKLWIEGGLKWLEENKMGDKRLKEELDYLVEYPAHYPSWITRPNLGCRTLVARNQHQVYPSIANDLKDWLTETRVKAAQLLYTMLYHSEQDIVMHTEKIFNCINTAAKDEEMMIKEYARKSSVIVGYMLEPQIWTPFMMQRLKEDPTRSHLLILGGLIRGSQRNKIQSQLRDIVVIISDDSVCLSLDEDFNTEILNCLESLIETLEEDVREVVFELFKLSIVVLGLTASDDSKNRVRTCQQNLVKLTAKESLEILYKENIQFHMKSLFLKPLFMSVE